LRMCSMVETRLGSVPASVPLSLSVMVGPSFMCIMVKYKDKLGRWSRLESYGIVRRMFG
jgi:hypothetical protein